MPDPNEVNQVSGESGGGKVLESLFVRVIQRLHLALRKLHRFTGLLDTGRANLGEVISEGGC